MGMSDEELRKRAIARVHGKRALMTQVVSWLVMSAFFTVIWFLTDRGFFWPVFPIAGWGVGIVLQAWGLRAGDVSEDQIQQEMNRLRGTGS
jgi:hypothetical protein